MASDVGREVPDVPPPLDSGVLGVIQSSADRLAEEAAAFADQLHAGLAAMVPDMADGGRVVCERIVQVLLWLATTGPSLRAAGDALRWVGAANQAEGFAEARYVDVARALVLAVRNVGGDSSANSAGSAWLSFFHWAEPYLRAGARQAAAEQEAAQQAAAAQDAARLEAARHAAGQAQAIAQDPAAGEPAAGDVDIEAVADLLGEEDEDQDGGYGEIMLGMTRNPRRPRA
jgi:uncharacterized protein involved in high-affinity Fe2+ transport